MSRHFLFLALLPAAFAADWNAKRAADYLDQRQKEWFGWKPALASGAPCVSCHTGLPYLLARPALRRMLGGGETTYEIGLLDSLKRMQKAKSAQATAVESVLAALTLTLDDPASPAAAKAFDRMWALQIREGPDTGAWDWFHQDLDPWEMPESRYFGASLAVVAVGSAPAEYRKRDDVRAHVTSLTGYLRGARASQSLHNRLALLWASTTTPELLSKAERRDLLDEVWRRQGADGGWTIESLGPFKEHAAAPPSTGSNAYATALASFVMGQAGVKSNDRGLKRALEWLKSNQDAETGSWSAESMNKRYEAGSMQSQFMRDAATGFAVLALSAGSKAN